MGLIRHHAIIVTGWKQEVVESAWASAKQAFGTLVTEVQVSLCNGYYTFFVGPDGSNEGWDRSNEHDALRAEFMLRMRELSIDAAEVQYSSETGVTWVRTEQDESPLDEED